MKIAEKPYLWDLNGILKDNKEEEIL
jgi:hypothetical protein